MKDQILIIDDMEERHHLLKQWLKFHKNFPPSQVISAYGCEEGIKTLDAIWVDCFHLFLDHDFDLIMHGEADSGTGADVAKHMVIKGYTIPTTIISINPAGAENIYHILDDAGIWVAKRPIFNFTCDMEGIDGTDGISSRR